MQNPSKIWGWASPSCGKKLKVSRRCRSSNLSNDRYTTGLCPSLVCHIRDIINSWQSTYDIMNIDCFCITNLCWLNQVKLSLLILYINMFKNVCWWNHHYPAIFVGKQAFSTEQKSLCPWNICSHQGAIEDSEQARWSLGWRTAGSHKNMKIWYIGEANQLWGFLKCGYPKWSKSLNIIRPI